MKRTYYRSIKVLFIQILPMFVVNVFLLFPVLSSSRNFLYLVISINCLALLFFVTKVVRRKVLEVDSNKVHVFRVFKHTELELSEIKDKSIRRSGFSSLSLTNGKTVLLPLFDLDKRGFEDVERLFSSDFVNS